MRSPRVLGKLDSPAYRQIFRRDPPRLLQIQVMPEFTAREIEVLERLCAGETCKESGAALGLSHRTVETIRYSIGKKTGMHRMIDLAVWAVKNKIVNL
jgi:DNA-binding NarL/FixJ family response regulator